MLEEHALANIIAIQENVERSGFLLPRRFCEYGPNANQNSSARHPIATRTNTQPNGLVRTLKHSAKKPVAISGEETIKAVTARITTTVGTTTATQIPRRSSERPVDPLIMSPFNVLMKRATTQDAGHALVSRFYRPEVMRAFQIKPIDG